jgi:TrmH family RNA methyltransferase
MCLPAVITSLANSRVKLVRALQTRRRVRYHKERLVAEGTRLVREALTADLLPDFIFYTANWADTQAGAVLLQSFVESGFPALLVADQVMASCTDTETPPGVLAVLPFPYLPPPDAPTLVMVVDRLRNPGNLGTVLRSAAAAGVEVVLVPPGNVDPFNPKVVRAGMGAHFQVPVLRLGWQQAEARLVGLDSWLASAGEGTPYGQVDWTRPAALILGGEAKGAGKRAADLVAGRVHIPMPGGTESLNVGVAAGILLFEIVRQRAQRGDTGGHP